MKWQKNKNRFKQTQMKMQSCELKAGHGTEAGGRDRGRHTGVGGKPARGRQKGVGKTGVSSVAGSVTWKRRWAAAHASPRWAPKWRRVAGRGQGAPSTQARRSSSRESQCTRKKHAPWGHAVRKGRRGHRPRGPVQSPQAEAEAERGCRAAGAAVMTWLL